MGYCHRMAKKLLAGIHARRSLNRADEQSASVRRQIAAGRQLAESLGAEVVKIWDEDDTSAFKKKVVTLPDGRRVKRNVRPKWQEMLRALHAGEIDILIEYDLDRAMREPRDLEDLIEVVEMTGRRVESVTGSLKLRNDSEISMARMNVAWANKSSRDTARRVKDAARDRAQRGLNHGGRRCFGYTVNGMEVVPDEARELVAAFDKFVKATPLGAIVRDFNERGVKTVTGAAWAPGTLRDLMLRPRLAGLASSSGEILGKAQWEPIIPEPRWREAVALLKDPSRRTTTGNKAAYLLSGIALCGVCGRPLVSGGKKGPAGESVRRMYRCRPPVGQTGSCVGRRQDWVDAYVTERIFERFCQDDVADLLVDEEHPDFAAVDDERKEIRERLDDAAISFARKLIDSRQLEIITKELQERLAEIDRLVQKPGKTAVLRELVEASLNADGDDARIAAVEAVWDRYSFDRRRAIISELMTIRILPGGGGRRTFDPTKVEIKPKR
jgi:site-specific DNA recombinase